MDATKTPTPSTTPQAMPRVGQVVGGRWHLDAVLGAGGMATVFEAHHRNGKRVAIKILRPELAHNAQALGRFQREGHFANAVDHPGVVSVLDEGISDEGLPFLVMEFLEGESLDDRLLRLKRPLSVEDALAIGVAALDALAATEAQGIVHRDLKPENIFLCTNGTIKILDFGIARLSDMPRELSTTQVGTTVGTPSFMAREQALGHHDKIDTQTDLWALGATLLYALTRRCVYRAPTVQELLVKVATEEPPAVKALAPSLAEPIAAVLDRALNPDRATRWRTAREMKEALLSAAREASIDIPKNPSLEGYTPPQRSRPPLAAGLPAPARAEAAPLPSDAPLALPASQRGSRSLAAPAARLAVAATGLALLVAVLGLGLTRAPSAPPASLVSQAAPDPTHAPEPSIPPPLAALPPADAPEPPASASAVAASLLSAPAVEALPSAAPPTSSASAATKPPRRKGKKRGAGAAPEDLGVSRH